VSRAGTMKTVRNLIITILCLLGSVPSAPGAETAVAPSGRAAAAVVNGAVIFRDELDHFVEFALSRRRGAGRKVTDEQKKRVERQELDKLIAMELLAQAGEKLNPADLSKKIQARREAIGSSVSRGGSVVAPSEDRLNDTARRDVLVDAYLASRGIDAIKVPETDLRAYYEKNKSGFKKPETIAVRHILVKIEKEASPETQAEARKKIEGIRDRIGAGADFAVLASESSDCASAAKGGDLGEIQRGFMPREFDQVAFSLKPGETSGIVKTHHGFHIIRVMERHPETVRTFEEMRDFIEQYLAKDYQRKKVEEIVEELKRAATIDIRIQ
jgi:peptidyl-prolyl cis-trans isomerase C